MPRTDCCNPHALRDEDRCIGCPMRTSAMSVPPTAQPAAPSNPDQKTPGPQPTPAKAKSLWAFLNGDIPKP